MVHSRAVASGLPPKFSKGLEKNMRKMMIAAIVAAGVSAAPAVAQQNGLVNVDVSNVLNNLDLDLLNNSLNNNTVQVPIGVAATVCDVNANVIAKQRKAGDYTCTAKTTSQALKTAAKKQATPKAQ
jgi:hypothetical protein